MKKILLIEDNPEMRENTAEILELSNYEVHTAPNGKVGVEKAREIRPDLIICDIMMPELDGYGVLYALGKSPETSNIPFIFLSAKAERADIRKGMNLGADDFLTKPFDDMELLEAVETRLKKNEMMHTEFERSQEGFNSFVAEAKNLDELIKVSESHQTRSFKKKHFIYQEGGRPHFLYLVNSGKIKTFRTNEDGKDYITGIHGAGHFLGYMSLLEDQPYTETAETLEDTELTLIPKEEFFSILHSNRQVTLKFVRMLAEDLSTTEDRLLRLAYNSVRRRVAEALMYLIEKYGMQNQERPSFSFTREDLANIAGTSTESAIRALADFREEGLLEMRASTITVLNPMKLSKVRN